MLDLLLKLLEICSCLNLLEEEDHTGNNSEYPEKNLKNLGAYANLNRNFLRDYVNVKTLLTSSSGRYAM